MHRDRLPELLHDLGWSLPAHTGLVRSPVATLRIVPDDLETILYFHTDQQLARGLVWLKQRETMHGKNFQEEAAEQKLTLILTGKETILLPDAMRRLLRVCALMGYSTVVWHTHGYHPRGGLPRYSGAYTPEELHALDVYADSLGIELVPGTYATIEEAQEAAPLRERYSFEPEEIDPPVTLARVLRTFSTCFSTQRVHIRLEGAMSPDMAKRYAADTLGTYLSALSPLVATAEHYGRHLLLDSAPLFESLDLTPYAGAYYSARVPEDVLSSLPENISLICSHIPDSELLPNESISVHKAFLREVWSSCSVSFAPGAPCCAADETHIEEVWRACSAQHVTHFCMELSQTPFSIVSPWQAALPALFYAATLVYRQPAKMAGARFFEALTGLPLDTYRAMVWPCFTFPEWCLGRGTAALLLENDPLLGQCDTPLQSHSAQLALTLQQQVRALRGATCLPTYLPLLQVQKALLPLLQYSNGCPALLRHVYACGEPDDMAACLKRIRRVQAAYVRYLALYRELWMQEYDPAAFLTVERYLGGLLWRWQMTERSMVDRRNGHPSSVGEWTVPAPDIPPTPATPTDENTDHPIDME